MELLHPAMWHDHDIDFVGWQHPAMWHVALKSWQWIHQVAAPPYGVDKSSTNLPGWGEGGAVTFVGWQITLCDPIDKWRPVVLRWISRRTIRSFTFTFTLQCDTWLWDDIPLNSPKRPPYWNSTSGFHFHISPQSTCHYVPVCEILSKSDHPLQKKTDVMSIFKMADLSHLGL